MTTSTAFISTFALHLCLCLNLPLPLSSLCPHHSIVLLLSHYLLAILHEIHFSDDQSIIYLKKKYACTIYMKMHISLHLEC